MEYDNHPWKNGDILQKEPIQSPDSRTSVTIVTYRSEGLWVKGYLLIPNTNLPCPAMIYCRGGINKVGMVRLERVLAFALRGYVVFAPFYRGNRGGEGREDFGGNDRYDVHHAIPVLRALEEVDSSPITIMGFSRGAIMALFTAMDSKEIGPVIIRGGVSDLWLTYEERVDMRRMLKRVVGRPTKSPEEYNRRSPINEVHKLNSPVLIVHGTKDEQVSVNHAIKLAEALKEAHKDYTIRLFEDLGHVFPPDQDEVAMNYIFDWIESKR